MRRIRWAWGPVSFLVVACGSDPAGGGMSANSGDASGSGTSSGTSSGASSSGASDGTGGTTGCAASMMPTLLYEGDVWGGNVAVADGMVYFTTYGDLGLHAVLGVPTCGGEPSVVWSEENTGLFGKGMAVDGGEVFWSQAVVDGGGDLVGAAVFRSPTMGGARMLVGPFSGPEAPYSGIRLVGDTVYAASFLEVVSVPRGGGEVTVVYDGAVEWGTVVQDGRLYLTSADRLLALTLPAGAPQQLAQLPAPASGSFDVDETHAYVATGDTLWKIPLTGGTPTALAQGTAMTHAVAGPDEVYSVADGMVLRVPKDGGAPEAMSDVGPSATMTLDGTDLYVAYCCGEGGGGVLRIPVP